MACDDEVLQCVIPYYLISSPYLPMACGSEWCLLIHYRSLRQLVHDLLHSSMSKYVVWSTIHMCIDMTFFLLCTHGHVCIVDFFFLVFILMYALSTIFLPFMHSYSGMHYVYSLLFQALS